MRKIALFSWKIYTASTNFTRPPVVTVATNLNSGLIQRAEKGLDTISRISIYATFRVNTMFLMYFDQTFYFLHHHHGHGHFDHHQVWHERYQQCLILFAHIPLLRAIRGGPFGVVNFASHFIPSSKYFRWKYQPCPLSKYSRYNFWGWNEQFQITTRAWKRPS